MSKVNLADMRQHAADLLGQGITPREAADMVVLNNRTWFRFENPNDDRHVPESIIKLFWYEVGLLRLEQLEDKGNIKEVERLLGGPMTAKRVSGFLRECWSEWDPRGGASDGD